MERRPKSASPHGNKRRVVLEHTNITEIVYDSSDNLTKGLLFSNEVFKEKGKDFIWKT